MTARSNNAITVNNAITMSALGGCTAIRQSSSGADINWIPVGGSPDLLGQMSVDSAYLSGDVRLVGVGFEVTDTSAEVNKQGMATVCAYPQAGPCDNYAVANAAGIASTFEMSFYHGKRIILPPVNIKDAMLLPETRQWEARYGAYMVPTFQDLGNPATEVSSIVPIFEQAATVFSPTANTTGASGAVPATNTSLQVSTTVPVMTLKSYLPAYQKIAPTNTCVVYLTGLNPSSTFVVSMIYYIETIPRTNDKSSVVVTQPAPEYDPFALQLYGRIVNHLPPGCMVGDNDSGNWFWNVVEKVSDFAAPLLGMSPHPMAQAGAVLARGANAYAKEKLNPKVTIPGIKFPPVPAGFKGAHSSSLVMAKPQQIQRSGLSQRMEEPVYAKKKKKKTKMFNRELSFDNRSRGARKGPISGPLNLSPQQREALLRAKLNREIRVSHMKKKQQARFKS